jgi:hypothetical protein
MITWLELSATRANRVRKLRETEEYILIHEERMPPNFGRADGPDEGSIRVWYDPVECTLYREVAYQQKPSTWKSAALPRNPDDDEEEAAQ